MGRRASKAGQETGAGPGFETVGVTILPGHPLPEWMTDSPASAQSADPVPPEADGFETGASAASDGDPAIAAETSGGAMDAPAAPPDGQPTWPAPGAVPDPREPALVGAFAPGAAAAGAATAAAPAPGPYTTSAYPPSPFRSGSYGSGHGDPGEGVGAGLGTPAPNSTTAPGAGVGSPYGAPGTGVGSPYGAPGAGGSPSAAPPMGAAGSPYPPTAHVGAGQPGGLASYGPSGHLGGQPAGAGTATMPAPPDQAFPGTGSAPADAGPVHHMTPGAGLAAGSAPTSTDPAGQPPAPSAGWTSPDRPELSPEHVALLTWWAEMIASGQFPAPNAAQGGAGLPGSEGPGAEAASDRSAATTGKPAASGGRRGAKIVALSLTVVAVGGLGLAFGQKALSAATADPAPVPTTELTMPATVGDLVAVTGPEVGAQLVPLVGFGLRPAGVTVTGAYGTDPAGPVALAAMATTVAAPADAAGQITAWAERAGASVSDPMPGSGATDGVTCAEVTENPAGPTGSVCVWSATGMHGLTYVIGTSPEAALQTTADARAAMPAPAAG